MNTGLMTMTILAMFLLSMTILNVNRGLLSTTNVMVSSRYNVMAISVGTSIMEDALSLRFDEVTAAGGAITDSTKCVASSALGLDAGESASNPAAFDDFDDYNCYRTTPKLDTIKVEGVTGKMVIFKTLCKVDYVTSTNPDVVSTTQTWHKRMRLFVYSTDLSDPYSGKTDTVKLSTVYSYWYFP